MSGHDWMTNTIRSQIIADKAHETHRLFAWRWPHAGTQPDRQRCSQTMFSEQGSQDQDLNHNNRLQPPAFEHNACMRCISGMYCIAIDYSRLPSIPTWSHCGAVIAVQSMAFQWSLEQSKDARPRTPTLPVLVSCHQKSKLCSALSGCMIAYHW